MLLGDFDGYAMWPWWSHFMGDIRYTSYIAQQVNATVKVDDDSQPSLDEGPAVIVRHPEGRVVYVEPVEPLDNVHVLATVDEST